MLFLLYIFLLLIIFYLNSINFLPANILANLRPLLAIDELFEETCGLVDCERAWLEAAPQCDVRLGRSGRKFGRLYALRVDGLARRHFKANRGALLALRAALKTRGPSRHPPRVVAVPVLNRLGDSAFWWLCSTACECAATGPF